MEINGTDLRLNIRGNVRIQERVFAIIQKFWPNAVSENYNDIGTIEEFSIYKNQEFHDLWNKHGYIEKLEHTCFTFISEYRYRKEPECGVTITVTTSNTLNDEEIEILIEIQRDFLTTYKTV